VICLDAAVSNLREGLQSPGEVFVISVPRYRVLLVSEGVVTHALWLLML